jgi:hypothetical protein
MKNSKKVLAAPAPLPVARHRTYYLKHRDRLKARARAYYAAHHDERRASQAVWAAAHREEIKVYKTATTSRTGTGSERMRRSTT